MTYSLRIELSTAIDTRAREIIAVNRTNFFPSDPSYREVLQLHLLRIYVESLPLSN